MAAKSGRTIAGKWQLLSSAPGWTTVGYGADPKEDWGAGVYESDDERGGGGRFACHAGARGGVECVDEIAAGRKIEHDLARLIMRNSRIRLAK